MAAAGSAKLGDEAISIIVIVEGRTKHHAKIQHVKHCQLANLDILLGEPCPHFGDMIRDRQISAARDDNCFQSAAPIRPGRSLPCPPYRQLSRRKIRRSHPDERCRARGYFQFFSVGAVVAIADNGFRRRAADAEPIKGSAA
jgi:hypothetical protein